MKTAKTAKTAKTKPATKPVKATASAKTAKVAKPVQAAKPAKAAPKNTPAKAVKAVKTAPVAKPAKSAKTVKATAPAKVTKAAKPTKVAAPVKPAKPLTPEQLADFTARFDALKQTAPKTGIVCWSARALAQPLGYAKWENFRLAVERTIGARKDAGLGTRFYFRELTTKNDDGLIVVNDYRLTRLACHAIAMLGDARQAPIAAARAYFAEPAKPAAAPKSAKPKSAKPAPAKTPKVTAKPAGQSVAKKAAAPKVAPAKKLTVPAKKITASRYIPQPIGGNQHNNATISVNSRWNPNCAVSRGYHNRAATNGR